MMAMVLLHLINIFIHCNLSKQLLEIKHFFLEQLLNQISIQRSSLSFCVHFSNAWFFYDWTGPLPHSVLSHVAVLVISFMRFCFVRSVFITTSCIFLGLPFLQACSFMGIYIISLYPNFTVPLLHQFYFNTSQDVIVYFYHNIVKQK